MAPRGSFLTALGLFEIVIDIFVPPPVSALAPEAWILRLLSAAGDEKEMVWKRRMKMLSWAKCLKAAARIPWGTCGMIEKEWKRRKEKERGGTEKKELHFAREARLLWAQLAVNLLRMRLRLSLCSTLPTTHPDLHLHTTLLCSFTPCLVARLLDFLASRLSPVASRSHSNLQARFPRHDASVNWY